MTSSRSSRSPRCSLPSSVGGGSGQGWCWSTRPGTAAVSRTCSSRTSRPSEDSSGVRGRVGARVGGARRHRARCRVRSNRGPERGRGVGEPQVDGPVLAQRGEHGELLRGEAGGAEERQPLGQPDDGGIGAQGRARRVDPLGGIGAADARAQPPPQLGLPRQIRVDPALARPPGPQQLGPVGGVGAEQLRHPAGQGVSAGVVGVEHGAPRLLRGRVEHLQQRPHRPLRVPRVGVGCAADRPADRLGDQRGGGAERHSRADAVAIGGAEPVREALRQPPLHPLRGYGHHLGGEGIGRWAGEHLGKGIGEHVGPLRPVHVDARGGHGVTVGAPTDSTGGGPVDHRT